MDGKDDIVKPFGERLWTAMRDMGPLCVGIDPSPELVASWGWDDTGANLERFGRVVVEAVAGEVAAVKPQSAFFERHGSAGIVALERVVADAKAAGLLVIMDVKRGDIDSTAQGYAEAYLNPESALGCDAMTVSPYLGLEALEPFYTAAERYAAGVFTLALTSNPGGATFQHAHTADGRTVAQTVIDEAARRNSGVSPLGSFGVVVGATLRDTHHNLSTMNGPFLAPGLGAQGATLDDLHTVFADALPAVLPAVSRSVLKNGPFVNSVNRAVRELCESSRRTIRGKFS